jgi:hypothetical protein
LLQSVAVQADDGLCDADRHRDERRRNARLELSRWHFWVPFSVARLLAEMQCDERRSPRQVVADWLRLNCDGGWRHVAMPGGNLFICMDDAACAKLFRVKFGGSQ